MQGIPSENWKARQRGDWPNMTRKMMNVLITLSDSADRGFPFTALQGVHPITIRKLEKNDWIVASRGDAVYSITPRGIRAMNFYQRDVKRGDGLCPDCGLRPRAVSASGKRYGYCRECERRAANKNFKLKGCQLDPNGICARCKAAPRFVASTGRAYCYCKECKNLMKREYKRGANQQLLMRIQAGEGVKCLKCNDLRAVHGKTVYDYCYEHLREYMNNYHHRRKFRNMPQMRSEALP